MIKPVSKPLILFILISGTSLLALNACGKRPVNPDLISLNEAEQEYTPLPELRQPPAGWSLPTPSEP